MLGIFKTLALLKLLAVLMIDLFLKMCLNKFFTNYVRRKCSKIWYISERSNKIGRYDRCLKIYRKFKKIITFRIFSQTLLNSYFFPKRQPLKGLGRMFYIKNSRTLFFCYVSKVLICLKKNCDPGSSTIVINLFRRKFVNLYLFLTISCFLC